MPEQYPRQLKKDFRTPIFLSPPASPRPPPTSPPCTSAAVAAPLLAAAWLTSAAVTAPPPRPSASGRCIVRGATACVLRGRVRKEYGRCVLLLARRHGRARRRAGRREEAIQLHDHVLHGAVRRGGSLLLLAVLIEQRRSAGGRRRPRARIAALVHAAPDLGSPGVHVGVGHGRRRTGPCCAGAQQSWCPRRRRPRSPRTCRL